MKRFVRKPSPSMVVALAALVVAMSGTAYAAVSYAINAGKVDGIDAARAGASNNYTAGKLVATQRLGLNKGKIPAAYLTLPPVVTGAGAASQYTKVDAVSDNAAGGQAPLFSSTAFGQVTVACNDSNNIANNENPQATFVYNNTTGAAVNFGRTGGAFSVVAPGTQSAPFVLDPSQTYTLNLQGNGKSLVVFGVFRQDGAATANGSCVHYGSLLQFG